MPFLQRQWRARPLACLCAAFLLGTMIADRLISFPVLVLPAALAAGIGYILLKRRHLRYAFMLLLLAALAVGGFRMTYAVETHAPIGEARSVSITGSIRSFPEYRADKQRIVCRLRVDSLDGHPCHDTVKLYIRSDTLSLSDADLRYGQHLTLTGSVWPQDEPTNAYQFDLRLWLLSDGQTGMASAALEDITVSSEPTGLMSLVTRIRAAISDRIDLLFPENAALVKAFVLGNRTELSSDMLEDFSATGVAHLICISGMHISVLAMAVSLLLGRLLPRNAAVLTTLVLVFVYGLLIGFPVSLVRAIFMFAVFSMAPLFGRASDPFTRLLLAAACMLLVDPLQLYRSGFALSYMASAGILLLDEPIEALLRVDRLRSIPLRRRPLPVRLGLSLISYYAQLLCASLAAQLGTLPIVLAVYGGQSILTPAVNLAVVPIALLAYPIALSAVVLSFIVLPLGVLTAFPADLLFGLLSRAVRSFATISAPRFTVPQLTDLLSAVYLIIMLAASPISSLPISVRRLLVPGLVLCLLVSTLTGYITSGNDRILFFDAGQADSALIASDRQVFLVDVGDEYGPAESYLTGTAAGIDAIFLTHPHSDHSGGLAKLLDSTVPSVIYVPAGWYTAEDADTATIAAIDRARSMGIPVLKMAAGDRFRLTEHLSVQCLSADPDAKDTNDRSLVLLFDINGTRALFTGDLTVSGEPESMPNVDILKVAHHGADTSTSELFLAQTTPQLAVISVGENSYGHPGQALLDRLNAVGSTILRTDETGMITVSVDEDGQYSVHTYLH